MLLVIQGPGACQVQRGIKDHVESLSLEIKAWMENLDKEERKETRENKDFQAHKVIAKVVPREKKVIEDHQGLKEKMAQRGPKVPKVKLVVTVQRAPKVLQEKMVKVAPKGQVVPQGHQATLDLKVTQGLLDLKDAVDVTENQVCKVILAKLELLGLKVKRERLSEW